MSETYNSKNTHAIVLVTTASKEEADKIAQKLLEEKLIACSNIIGPVSSLFWWKNRIEKTEEYILLVKSRLDLFEKLSKRVKSLHTYEVPEIIALPIMQGSKAYLEWINENIR